MSLHSLPIQPLPELLILEQSRPILILDINFAANNSCLGQAGSLVVVVVQGEGRSFWGERCLRQSFLYFVCQEIVKLNLQGWCKAQEMGT